MEASPGVLDAIVQVILQNGLAGVGLIALGWTCRGLFARNNALNDKVYDLALKTAQSQSEVAASMNRLVDVIRVKAPE
jgi:hypothetical protein